MSSTENNHSLFTAVHRPYAAVYADAAARAAATGFARGIDGAVVAFAPVDLHKLVLQLDNNTEWVLTDDSPVTWVQVGGAGVGGPPSGSAGGDLSGTYPNPTVGGGAAALNPAFTVLTDGATITWATGGARVNNAKVTLGGNRTLDITGEVDGASGVLIVIQDGTGGRTLTLPGSSKVIGGGAGAITLTATAGAIDILSWVYDGTNFYWTKGLNFT